FALCCCPPPPAAATSRLSLHVALPILLAAIYMGFVTLLIAPGLSHDVPPIALVLVSTTPVLALSFGAAAYSSGLVKAIEKWRSEDRKSTRLNSSHVKISYAVFCWKKKR